MLCNFVANHDRIVWVPHCHTSYSIYIAILRTESFAPFKVTVQLYVCLVSLAEDHSFTHRAQNPAFFIDADPPRELIEVLAGSRPAGNASRSEHRTAVAR